MRRRLACLVPWLLCACQATLSHVQVATPPVRDHVPVALYAGTGRADITMPPGAATFGHGPDARVTHGYWTRTYCRVFYFEGSDGRKLALVPCELSAMSMLLQRAVAARVADILHPSQLMMTAVHTHAGVAHYFGASQYTGLFSTRHPGFDPALLRAMADRVAQAIRHARRSALPARLSWKHSQDFWCFTRNRSLQAYKLDQPPFAPAPPSNSSCPYLDHEDARAIDPQLDVLRIDGYDRADPSRLLGPIGSLSFYAMHPTVIANTNRLFGGDVAGVVSRHVERELRRQWAALHPELQACLDPAAAVPCAQAVPDPLHGVINTDEGDISPIWVHGDIDEAISLGERVGAFVWSHHPPLGSGAPASVLDARYIEEDIRGAKLHDGHNQAHWTCRYSELGQGSARGATDHPTSVAPLPLFEGKPPIEPSSDDCQAPKRPLLGQLSLLTRPKGTFPWQLPLAVAQLGDTLLAFVPAEVTLTAGHRITARIHRALARYPGAPQKAVIAGLANEYIQYVATHEEYQLQAYEGASTLYGPWSAQYLGDRMALLSRSMFDPGVDRYLRDLGKAKDVLFPWGPLEKRMAQPSSERSRREPLLTCSMPGSVQTPRVCMVWHDAGPGDVALRHAPWIRATDATPQHRPLRLCRADAAGHCDPGGYVDDRGTEFRTRVHDRVHGGWVWSTLFVPPVALWQELAAKPIRLRAGSDAHAPESPAFSASAPPPLCTPRQARLCIEGERTEDWDGLVPE